jgi:succinate-acetate transporter protein
MDFARMADRGCPALQNRRYGRQDLEETTMKLANPAPLGLSGFALTTWMLSLVNAGYFGGPSVPLVLATAFAFGGTAQFFAGLMEMPRGNTFGFVAFCSYGAFWWTFALFVEFFGPANVPAAFVGWWLAMWGVFSLFMFVGTLALNRALQAIFFVLVVTFFLLAGADLFGIPALKMAGGYMGLLTAALAFYLAAAEVINETHGHTVLPVGAPEPKAAPSVGLRKAA